MRISIAMATYNGERYLAEQLDSLARQTLSPCELVVSDDGSTDRTLEVVEQFARHAPFPVRIFQNETRLGYGENFLKAASLAEGDWIAFCDQDDVWREGKLKRVSEAILPYPGVVLVVHSADVADGHLAPRGDVLPRIPRFRVCGPLQNRPWFTAAGFVCTFSSRLIEDIPWQQRSRDFNDPERMQAHDQWIQFLANVMGSVAYLPDRLAVYRRHEAAVTGSYDVSPAGRLKRIVRTGRDHYLLLASVAEEYSRFLKGLAEQTRSEYRDAFYNGASYFERLATWTADRAALYDYTQPVFPRIRILADMMRQGADSWWSGAGYGTRALAKDLLLLLARSGSRIAPADVN